VDYKAISYRKINNSTNGPVRNWNGAKDRAQEFENLM